MSTEPDAATRLLDKLRTFASDSLDDEERGLLAALIGPGIGMAYREDDEVEGFGVDWSPSRLPDFLADAIRDRSLRIVED